MSFKSFEKNIQSQFGEDGVIEEIFRRIGTTNKICIEFGAWDGVHLSNTWNLWHNLGWRALLIEGDKDKFETLLATVRPFKNASAVHAQVTATGSNSLGSILAKFDFPEEIDLLSIDIDGDEYYIFQNLQGCLPRVLILEYNPTIPPGRELVQAPGEYFGASALSLLKLGHSRGYKLAHLTDTNIFFVHQHVFDKLSMEEPSLESIFVKTNLTYLVSSYDGQTFLDGPATYTGLEGLAAGNHYPEIIAASPGIRKIVVHAAEQPQANSRGIRSAAKKTFIYPLWKYWKKQKAIVKENIYQKHAIKKWEKAGRPAPPPSLFKRSLLKQYGTENHIRLFVETGTYLGDTVSYLKKYFRKLISIELDPTLYDKAKKRFSGNDHISIYHGDSAELLPGILAAIGEPCLFWLDGHYSGGITAKGKLNTPIMLELDCILGHGTEGHVVLIDDARCFTGADDYPTVAFLESWVRQKNPALRFSVKDDIIRIHK